MTNIERVEAARNAATSSRYGKLLHKPPRMKHAGGFMSDAYLYWQAAQAVPSTRIQFASQAEADFYQDCLDHVKAQRQMPKHRRVMINWQTILYNLAACSALILFILTLLAWAVFINS